MKGFCVDCKHFQSSGDTAMYQLCLLFENEKEINYVTGEATYPYGRKYRWACEGNCIGQCTDFERAKS